MPPDVTCQVCPFQLSVAARATVVPASAKPASAAATATPTRMDDLTRTMLPRSPIRIAQISRMQTHRVGREPTRATTEDDRQHRASSPPPVPATDSASM